MDCHWGGDFLGFAIGPETALRGSALVGKKAPALHLTQWIPNKPDTSGKFVLIDFWAMWCPPCRRSIPKLNQIQQQFTNQLVVIGITSEPESTVRSFYKKHIHYWVGIDSQNEMASKIQLRYIPHALLVDPDGIVRWQGNPATGELTSQLIQKLIQEYHQLKTTHYQPLLTPKATASLY